MRSYLANEIFERRERWARALRSGDYRQGGGTLRRTDDSYCCLGVACEVFMEELNIKREVSSSTRLSFKYETETDNSVIVLPQELRTYLGLSWTDQNVLICLNDLGVSFDIIGAVILEMAIEIN